MSPEDIVNESYKYFETIQKEIFRSINKEAPLQADFMSLAKHNPQVAELLLDSFEETFEAIKFGLKSFCDKEEQEPPEIMFFNLPEERRKLIGNLRSVDMKKLFFTDGRIRHKSDVRPRVVMARFECPGCANVIQVLQLDDKFKEPTRCSCGRKGRFRTLHKEFSDAQMLSIQENFRDLQSGEQPREIKVLITGRGLTSPLKERKYLPGNTVRVVGVIKELPQYFRTGSQKTTYDIMIEANNIVGLEQSLGDIDLSKEEEKKILKASKDKKLYDYLLEAIAPGLMGCEIAKKATLLFLFNGPRYAKTPDQTEPIRGITHTLFAGDASTGKTHLLNFIYRIHPRCGYAQGPGMTGPGLTSTVVKDEHFGWVLEGGKLAVYNGGCLVVDEFEKAQDDAKNALHSPLETGFITVDKANIHAEIPAETALLVTANPEKGVFDRFSENPPKNQLSLPETLLSRFDMIILFFDKPEEDKGKSEFVLKKFEYAGKGKKQQEVLSELNPFRDTDFFRKYILYAIRNCNPIVTMKKCKVLTEFYNGIRQLSSENITITLRQMEALIRLTGAHAKIRLAEYATKKDALFAIQLYKDMWKLMGVDIDAGQIPQVQDVFEPGLSWSKQEQRNIILQTIRLAEKINGKKTIIKSLLTEALLSEEVFGSEEELEFFIDKLRKSGDLFIPKTIDIEGQREELIALI